MSNCVKQTLDYFRFSTLQNNTVGGIIPPRVLTPAVETRIATLTVPVDCDDFVWLSATVGYLFTAPAGGSLSGTVVFRIYRDNELTPIFSTQQSVLGLAGVPFGFTTSFSHVDHKFPCTSDCVTYILTVTADVPGFSLTGPVTFIAAVIENKRHHEEHKHEDKHEHKHEDKHEDKCEDKHEDKCERNCECKCQPKCRPHHKPYYQSYDFD